MKINKALLHAALELPVQISSSRNSIRRLLLNGEHGALTIEANDGDQSCLVTVKAEGSLPPICVSPSTFQNAVAWSAEEIELNLGDHDVDTLIFKSGRRTLRIATAEVSDFPHMAPATQQAALPPDVLAKSLRRMKFFVAENSDRYVLKSAHVVGTAGSLYCESTSGAQFSACKESVICSDFDVLIPSNFKDTVAEALRQPAATLFMDEKWLTVTHDSGNYTCKLSEGVFPQTEKVVYGPAKLVGIIDRKEWVDEFLCIKSIRDESEAMMVRVSMEFSEKECVITTAGKTPYTQTIDGNFTPAHCFVNAITFIDCLRAFDEPAKIRFEIPEEGSAIRLEDAGYVIMTCQLRAE